jgi:gas vesicle protein
MSRERSSLSYWIAGVGTGAAVAILFAPQSGTATRKLIGRTARSTVRKTTDSVKRGGKELVHGANGLAKRGRQAVNQVRDHLAAAVEAGKQAYRAEIASR